jgi:putative spermidine/putrescine transport system ATP-binding protein
VFEPKLVLMDEPLGALDKAAARADAARDPRLHAALCRDDGVRDARPGRGADDVRSHRRLSSRQDPAARPPGASLRAPVNAFVARFIGENNRFDGTLQTVSGTRCSIRIAAT